jgi:Domain of unknown function (DUF4124)
MKLQGVAAIILLSDLFVRSDVPNQELFLKNIRKISSSKLLFASALFSLLSLMLAPNAALAQFKWKDASGRWVYSDQPPPSSANIQTLNTPTPKPAALQTAAVPSQKLNADDKSLAEKRKASDAAQESKEKQELTKKNQVACDQTRANLKSMQGDLRVTATDANGERRFLSEQEKQSRTAAAQKDLANHCNG